MKKRAYIPQDIRSLGLLALCLALGLALGSCRAETPPVIGDTPIVVTEAPTLEAEPLAYPPPPTDTPAGYPPPGGPFVPPTPRPTFTPLPPTPTPWSVADLPLLPTYAPPGQFSGMRIVYSNRLSPGLRTIKVDGTEETIWPEWPIEQVGGLQGSLFRASPDGKKILYSLWNPMDQDIASVWVMNPNGSDRQPLVEATNGWYPMDAIWSADGSQIAYRGAYQEGGAIISKELWVMDTDGSNQRLVLDNLHIMNLYPGNTAHVFQWSSNGYIYCANFYDQLYAINPSNGNYYRILDEADPLDLRFSISPDGQHAVNQGELSMSTLQSAGFTAIDVDGKNIWWSPDGLSLVYQDNSGMWFHNVSTGEEELLLPGSSFNAILLHGFSPDSRYIAYQVDEGIFIIDVMSPEVQPQLVVADQRDDRGDWVLSFKTWVPIP